MQGNAFSTIHITPEDGFSYASVELCGYTAEAVDAAATVAQIAAIFRPAELSIALSVDTNVPGCHWGTGLVLPDGYTPAGASAQELRMGGRVEYYTMQRSMVDLKGGTTQTAAAAPHALCSRKCRASATQQSATTRGQICLLSQPLPPLAPCAASRKLPPQTAAKPQLVFPA